GPFKTSPPFGPLAARPAFPRWATPCGSARRSANVGLVPAGLLLAAATTGRSLAIIMAVGMLLLFAILATLVWTRFGQARPMTKCVFLSLLAHLLLIIYAYSTHILFGPPGKWYGQEVTIRLMDAADDQEAALVTSPNPNPWEQVSQAQAPIFDAPP